jgi:signal transduction histidine kinase
MTELRWYRSLYWRIALGFVGVLATMVVGQTVVFLWVTGRVSDMWPGRSPAEFAQLVASDAAAVLATQPAVDLDAHLNQRFTSMYRGFVVVMRDRRVIYSLNTPAPSTLGRMAVWRLEQELGVDLGPFEDGGRGGRGGRGRGGSRGGGTAVPSDGRFSSVERSGPSRAVPPMGGFGGRRGGEPPPGRNEVVFAPIRLDNVTVGIVAVSSTSPPLSAALNRMGPALGLQAIAMLAVGAVLVALVVFRPASRRLQGLTAAVREFGEGRTDVRAPTDGGDEVAQLASAFNEMAGRLDERTRQLVESDRIRRQLLADVSHELGTPLAAIKGYVETLSMPDVPLSDATRHRYLGIVSEEAERLDRLVVDLLDLARLEGGGAAWSPGPVRVDSLFGRVRDRHAPVLAERGLQIVTRVEPVDATVLGDATRLEQALQNLAANAIRHSPTGGTVALTARLDDEWVVIHVDDSGPGVPPEHLPRVFDRFYKVDESRTGTEVPSGSGLGLSIVRAIVQRHGGTASVSNLHAGGARFTLRIPACGSSVSPR